MCNYTLIAVILYSKHTRICKSSCDPSCQFIATTILSQSDSHKPFTNKRSVLRVHN